MRPISGTLLSVVAVIVVFAASVSQLVQGQPQQQQEQQQQRHSFIASRGGRGIAAASRYNRTSTPASCEYRELMSSLHDRVGLLVSLDENQRTHLDTIEKKIVQFEENNLARLDSLGVQQMDASRRLDAIDQLQRWSHQQLEELKGDFRRLQQQPDTAREVAAERVARQANSTDGSTTIHMRLDCSAKLDALSILLTSTRLAVHNLHLQLAENVTRLAQTTSNLQRSFNNFARRQQSHGVPTLVPLQPNLFAASADSGSPAQELCSYVQPGDSLGLRRVHPARGAKPFYAACDDKTQGGGWTVIQSRHSGEVNFQRDWLEYRAGFGNLAGEFFLGLDKLHALTSATLHELLILLADETGTQRYARYSSFAVGDEAELYTLKLLGAYAGDAGDSFSYHAGSKFSTFDRDNDGWLEGNCALAHTGAWWYNACEKSNLNGQFLGGEYDKGQIFQGMYWEDFRGPTHSLQSVRMMIRPLDAEQVPR